MFTRRAFVSLLAAGPSSGAESALHYEYRAKATVLMLSLPTFSRTGVGGGFLRLETADSGRERMLRFEFGAGSNPERAAGLNRLGVFEEDVTEAHGRFSSATYFGFMTSSAEKSIEQAQRALGNSATPAITAIRGRILGGRVWNRLLRLTDVQCLGWTQHRSLTSQVRRRIESIGEDSEAACQQQQPCTFLYAVSRAVSASERERTRAFVHNGEILSLRTEREPAADGHIAVRGRIATLSGKELSSFRA